MTNTLYTGDILYLLNGMNSDSEDLIYLEPPFYYEYLQVTAFVSKSAGDSCKDMWTWQDVDEVYLESLVNEYPSLVKLIQSIQDTHGKSMMAYITYMTQLLIPLHRVLKKRGRLYVHVHPAGSPYLEIVLEQIFGKPYHRTEMIYSYRKQTNASAYFQKKHDVILHYAKNSALLLFHKFYHRPTESQKKVMDRGYNVNQVKNGLQ